MALTPDQARAAFQNAIPRQRDEFEQKVRDRLLAIVHEANYPLKYPLEVLEMAQAEVRSRHKAAAFRVKQLLDSGWRPNSGHANALRTTFIDMFAGFDHWKKDPSSDLYHRVEAAFGEVGHPAHELKHQRALGVTRDLKATYQI